MQQRKKVLLISYYGRVCLSTKILSAVLRNAGHETYLIYLKDDRSTPVNRFNPESKCFQFIRADRGGAVYGTGTDVNPLTHFELDLLAQKCAEISPDVVALSSRSVHLELSRSVAQRLRQVMPKARFIAGGYGPSLEPEKFLGFVDFVCIGKGDFAILDLVGKQDPTFSPNVATLIDGKLHVSPLHNQRDLESRPFADWDLENKFMIEDDAVFPLHTRYDLKTYAIIASEGCPSTCTYCQACQWPAIYRLYDGRIGKVLMRSPQSVIAELKEAKARTEIGTVHFMDSIFTWHKKWLRDFLPLYEKHVALPFFCYTDARFTSMEQIRQLKESGMFSTTIGIQSVDEQSRKRIMGRNVSDARIIEFAWDIISHNITPTYDIIVWNPFETNASLANGVNFLKQLPKSNRIFVYELKMLPKSTLWNLASQLSPKPLSIKDYLYWSWVFMMVLRSSVTEKHTDSVLAEEKYRNDPYLLHALYLDLLKSMDDRERLFCIRPIAKGDTLRPTMFIEKASSNAEGVVGEDRHYITGKVAKRSLQTGELLRYKDFFTSYQER